MSNKQSSVEWLFQKLWDTPKDKLNWYAILNQAKAMHKDEIKKAWLNGYIIIDSKNVETYYNETFGGNNEI